MLTVTTGIKRSRASKVNNVMFTMIIFNRIEEHKSSWQGVNTLRLALVFSYDFVACYKVFGITRQLLPVLLKDKADYHPGKELFPAVK